MWNWIKSLFGVGNPPKPVLADRSGKQHHRVPVKDYEHMWKTLKRDFHDLVTSESQVDRTSGRRALEIMVEIESKS